MRPLTMTLAPFGLAALVAGIWVAAAAAAEPAAKLPRYRLQVGQELVYSGTSEFKYKGGEFKDRASWHIWVVRANPDGSWRLILRNGTAFSQDNRSQPEDVTFAYCDLFPDGRIPDNDSLGFRAQPSSVLPVLPKDEAEAKQGWSQHDGRMDQTTRYRPLPPPAAADRCAFEVSNESPMDAIYGITSKSVVTFDTQRGLPEKFESENKQTYGFDGSGKGTTKLDEVMTHDADWTRQFAAESERYFAAQDAYRKALEDRSKSAAETKAALEQAKEALKAARNEVKLPELRKLLDDDLAKHDRNAKYYVEEAERRAGVLNRPAADWSTTDLAGKPHALKDYRGKVVILDFWYRGCGWCVRSMPQMKEVADHFKDKPVVVFGMNTDRKEEDAKFVVEKMGLNYTNLKAEGLPEKYGVRGFPTLLIIDQDGVVRDVHVGYSPKLKEEVVKSVEKLLKGRS